MKALIWNTQMKKVRKCSNISVKKYQKTPMFGARSGTDKLKQNLRFTHEVQKAGFRVLGGREEGQTLCFQTCGRACPTHRHHAQCPIMHSAVKAAAREKVGQLRKIGFVSPRQLQTVWSCSKSCASCEVCCCPFTHINP